LHEAESVRVLKVKRDLSQTQEKIKKEKVRLKSTAARPKGTRGGTLQKHNPNGKEHRGTQASRPGYAVHGSWVEEGRGKEIIGGRRALLYVMQKAVGRQATTFLIHEKCIGEKIG